MIVSAAQPYFAPYPGFFVKAALSDTMVLLDGVQLPQQTTWMTIPVWRKGLGFQKIREVKILLANLSAFGLLFSCCPRSAEIIRRSAAHDG